MNFRLWKSHQSATPQSTSFRQKLCSFSTPKSPQLAPPSHPSRCPLSFLCQCQEARMLLSLVHLRQSSTHFSKMSKNSLAVQISTSLTLSDGLVAMPVLRASHGNMPLASETVKSPPPFPSSGEKSRSCTLISVRIDVVEQAHSIFYILQQYSTLTS